MTIDKLEYNILRDINEMVLFEESYGKYTTEIDREEVEKIIKDNLYKFREAINQSEIKY